MKSQKLDVHLKVKQLKLEDLVHINARKVGVPRLERKLSKRLKGEVQKKSDGETNEVPVVVRVSKEKRKKKKKQFYLGEKTVKSVKHTNVSGLECDIYKEFLVDGSLEYLCIFQGEWEHGQKRKGVQMKFIPGANTW